MLPYDHHTYLPFLTGKYETAPGLKPLGTDHGMGAADQRIFQIGDDARHFLKNKQVGREENLKKYYCTYQNHPQTMQAVNAFILHTLVKDYPAHFQTKKVQNYNMLQCALSREDIQFSSDYTLVNSQKYISLFDALCAQVPEDVAVWQVHENTDWLAALHICAPNYWAPEEKIGLNFSGFHSPVPGLEGLRQRYFPMLQSILAKGSFVRFGWGLTTDFRLNHHPQPPPGIAPAAWHGRKFDPNQPQLYVRTERQVLTGLADVNAVLFTIRTYFTDVVTLSPKELHALESAILSISPAALVYKGLDESRDGILGWLKDLRNL